MGGKTLTRADLAEAVVRKIGLPRNESQDLVELVLGDISTALASGDGVKLSSFGSFGVRSKGQRIGRPVAQSWLRLRLAFSIPTYKVLLQLVKVQAPARLAKRAQTTYSA